MAALERYQLPLYLGAALLGAGVGFWAPGLAPWGEALLWPALAALLFATFLQVPLLALRRAFRDRAFLLAGLVGNFLLIPLLVFGLLPLLPPDPGLRLGVALVLLVPCTDWFLAFAHLGRGDVARALILTPLNLFLQLLLLPFYLLLLLGGGGGGVPARSLLEAALVVLLPLFLALFLQARSLGPALAARTASWPVPLLALVVFLVALGHAGYLPGLRAHLGSLLALFALYLLLALGLAWALARLFRLEARAGRTLAFSLGTRNSFLVLPLALALPEGMGLAPLAIVLQALVELLGMGAAVRLVPRLFP
ncbi:bile acid:sodium symporter [Thermus thermamylovorans]|uniref:Arsenic resistance protein n=1 Tax=Thermus thermamylovorans TaxID=2509362 RepID=A0A4V2IV86_9DEIN|nr:bile acid:sodium symporter [Thermus thermamylovorans]TBH21325.1 arsenic resistance protein [Thermus thermamylovorans]